MPDLRSTLGYHGNSKVLLGKKILPFFAKQIAPYDGYNAASYQLWLGILEQKENDLRCVYCDSPKTDWDHLRSTISNGTPTGFGHTFGNLVPCCKSCNSKKLGRPWRDFVTDTPENQKLRARLEKLECQFPTEPIELSNEWQSLVEKRAQILALLEQADKIVQRIHAERKSR